MNRIEVQRLREYTAEHPDTMEMQHTFGTRAGVEPEEGTIFHDVSCGYTACLAGNTLLMKGYGFGFGFGSPIWVLVAMPGELHLRSDLNIIEPAREILEMGSDWLFFEGEWPFHYQNRNRGRSEHERALELLDDILAGALKLTEYEELHRHDRFPL